MSLSLDTLVRDLAGYLETRLDVSNDVYTLTVPLPQNRHQDVSATVRTDHEGHGIIDFVSTVGEIAYSIDPWYLLAQNDRTLFCRVTAVRGMIFVVASQLLETAQNEEVLLMLREVATVADRLEYELFNKDVN
ncbi:MAG: hypothetical protein NVSMB42_08430 [Herpetosiphon sp.]